MIVTPWSFAQHQRLGVPPPSRLPRRLHRGLDLEWDFKIKNSEKKSAPIVETENKSKMMDFFNIYP